MTLPTDMKFPKYIDYEDEDDPSLYLNDLTISLQDMYEKIAQNVNGTFRNSFDVDSSPWTPVLKGTTAEGTFTYGNQYGLSLRQGILTEIWGDVSWTATTATGNLYVELPYLVSKSSGIPFVGVCQSSTFAYTTGAYVTINAIPSTRRGEIWCAGTGATTTNQVVPAAGRVIFHLHYIGVADE